MAEFPVNPGRTALVIVDMQHCFVADSPIAALHGIHVAERLNQLAAAGRQSGVPVIWTRHVVRPDGGLGAASAVELQRAACAEVVSVDEVLSQIPPAVTAAAEA